AGPGDAGYGVWINGRSDVSGRTISIHNSSFDTGADVSKSLAFDSEPGGAHLDITNNTFGDVGVDGNGAIRVFDFGNTELNTPLDYSGIHGNTFVNAPDASNTNNPGSYGLLFNQTDLDNSFNSDPSIANVVTLGQNTYGNGSGPTYAEVINARPMASGQTLTGSVGADIIVGSDASGSGDTISAGGGNDYITA